MKIYVASSWRHQHGVEMLTSLLRHERYEVVSWIENNFGELEAIEEMSFDEWVKTQRAAKCFEYDVTGAMTCDLLIYYGSAGKDAAAEVGMAFAKGIPIIGLWAKGEDFGLMRRMMRGWAHNFRDLLQLVYVNMPNPYSCFGRKPHVMDFDDPEEFSTRLANYRAFENHRSGKIKDEMMEEITE